MKCPKFRVALLSLGVSYDNAHDECLKQDCEWFNEHFGRCSLAVDAYLKGQEDHRLEVKQAMKDRW